MKQDLLVSRVNPFFIINPTVYIYKSTDNSQGQQSTSASVTPDVVLR